MAKKWRDLVAKLPPERRARMEERTRELIAQLPLQELRRARELTQARMAELMDTSQSEISKIEQRTDMYISTLRSYIEAMGGELEIRAVFGSSEVRITQFGEGK
jgi:hypothetical protein